VATRFRPASIGNNSDRRRVRERDEGVLRQIPRTTVSKFRPIEPQASGIAEGSGVSRPKLGLHGRREIGRALEALYEDVVKQGVPPRILELLESLDVRAGGNLDSSGA
jgi:hypothetical protein